MSTDQSEIDRLKAVNAELLAACRFVVNRQNLMFAECSDAEEILDVCRNAIARTESHEHVHDYCLCADDIIRCSICGKASQG